MESHLSVMALRVWSLGFTSIAIGALATMALSLGRAKGAWQLRLSLVLACLSAISALAIHGPFALLVLWESTGLDWPDGLRLLIAPFGEALVGFLWLCVMILFEDARITPLRLAPTALLMAISTVSLATWGSTFPYLFGWLAVMVNVSLAAHAFLRVAQGWRDDLVEKRRRLRRPVVLILGLALALVLIIQGVDFAGRVIASFPLMIPLLATLNIALAMLAVAAGAMLLEPRAVLIAPSTPLALKETADDAESEVLAKLESLMTKGEVWRREGLSVGVLAAEVGVPEHRLRMLINRRLGHRNFAAFINARRIDAACRLLADPSFVDAPISKIAYDLGFASLGPFNRAFKDATQVTPTEWRRSNQPSPHG